MTDGEEPQDAAHVDQPTGDSEPHAEHDAAPDTGETAQDEVLLGPENLAEPESPERIQATKDVLSELVKKGSEHAHPFRRPIEKTVYEFDPRANDMYEKQVPVKTGHENLQTIDLRTYTSDDGKESYHMSVSFLPGDENSQLMLSGEWPLDFGIDHVALVGSALQAGLSIQGRRIQDLLYREGSSTLPVREADFSLGIKYRPLDMERSFNANRPMMDTILQILAHAHVVAEGQPVAKVAELVPEVQALAQHA